MNFHRIEKRRDSTAGSRRPAALDSSTAGEAAQGGDDAPGRVDPAGRLVDLPALAATPLQRDPYDHLIVPRFLAPEAVARVVADFPRPGGPGSFPVQVLRYGPAFAALLDELRSEPVREAFAAKFGVDLSRRPSMITVRGECRPTDGRIHTDSVEKIITVLIYLNEDWQSATGRLRILRSGHDLDDFVAEAAPEAGSMIAFRRSENSFHGHHPFSGPRRAIQLNWVTSRRYVIKEQLRHRLSAFGKRLGRRSRRDAPDS
ncbi:MAG: 2OG-Fe(II) oxygenase [Alphaproteobacteria bacterium]